MPILTPQKPKRVDNFGRLVDSASRDLGLLVSDALGYAPLAMHFEEQDKVQKEDPRVQLLDSEKFVLILEHASEVIGNDWYVLPDVFRAYDKEGGFGLRIVKGLPLATAKRIADYGLAANKSDEEFFAFPKDYDGLEDALGRAKRYDTPDGAQMFERTDDPKLSRFARYEPVKDCFGEGAEHLAAHIVSLGNDAYFGNPDHNYLTEQFKRQKGKVMLRPLFVGPVGIYGRYYDYVNFNGSGRSRLVVPVGAQKTPSEK